MMLATPNWLQEVLHREAHAAGVLPSAARRPLRERVSHSALHPAKAFTIQPLLLACSVFMVINGLALGQSPPTEESARKVYISARAQYQTAGHNPSAGWEFGRAAYDLAEFIQDATERNQIAEAGMMACRQAISQHSGSAPARYYLALNLGQLARAKKLGALKIIPEMERELLRATELDPYFDYAGPHRSLGMLYLEAPGWPLSIGNRNKARWHLNRAIELKPEYPENHICLLEARAKWNELRKLERDLKTYLELLPKLRPTFATEQWAASWNDWHKRLAQVQRALDQLRSNPPVSPSERGARMK